jgi:[ribosomal protein S18]-alanine N-acetyltransferase
VRRLKDEQDFQVRVMMAQDLPAVTRLQQSAFTHPWSPELLQRELTHEWSTILLVEETLAGKTALLGFSIFWLVHDELHVLNVATAPEARRRGVARAAMDATLDRARQKGCTLATLEVRRSNEPALELYRSLGFRPVGIRPKYYADENEDAVVMLMDL